MATQKLFYGDSHAIDFTATVLSCEPSKVGFQVVLDRTQFYPEGGGQPCDLGRLGGTAVTDVREKDGVIVHTCDGPLIPNTQVDGQVDWVRRFDLMQQHSGEHIVSGIVHKLFGLNNVGFHMGADMITIDFNGELTEDQILQVEHLANGVVWKNIPVLEHYPDQAALDQLDYRSKKALTGQVRLVEFPDIDLCACCGTHVRRTGEIGVIRLFSCAKFRSGCRIEMLSGSRCLAYLRNIWDQNRQISGQLSAKPLETAAAVSRMTAELADTKYRLAQLENQCFDQQARGLQNAGDVLLREENLSPDAIRRLAIAVAGVCGGRAAVFSGSDESGYQYALGHEGGDLRQLSRRMNEALDGRGGGKPNFVQGSVRASWTSIAAFFETI